MTTASAHIGDQPAGTQPAALPRQDGQLQQPRPEHTASAGEPDGSADRSVEQPVDRTAIIRRLNDALRTGFAPGQVMLTPAVVAMRQADRLDLFHKVCRFDRFTPDNDPYGEHDFGSVQVAGQTWFWKIDCYDLDLQYGSPDPADPAVSRRVLTIMAAWEY